LLDRGGALRDAPRRLGPGQLVPHPTGQRFSLGQDGVATLAQAGETDVDLGGGRPSLGAQAVELAAQAANLGRRHLVPNRELGPAPAGVEDARGPIAATSQRGQRPADGAGDVRPRPARQEEDDQDNDRGREIHRRPPPSGAAAPPLCHDRTSTVAQPRRRASAPRAAAG
jgi:hypothetical protein